MIESAGWANKLALPALQDCPAVDAVLPVMESIILLRLCAPILTFVGEIFLFHVFKLTISMGAVKVDG